MTVLGNRHFEQLAKNYPMKTSGELSITHSEPGKLDSQAKTHSIVAAAAIAITATVGIVQPHGNMQEILNLE